MNKVWNDCPLCGAELIWRDGREEDRQFYHGPRIWISCPKTSFRKSEARVIPHYWVVSGGASFDIAVEHICVSSNMYMTRDIYGFVLRVDENNIRLPSLPIHKINTEEKVNKLLLLI